MDFYRRDSKSESEMPFLGLRRLAYRAFCSKVFSRNWQDKFERQVFFNKAFSLLAFNEISGDYVEFGSHRCRTFAMAHKESRRRWLSPRLWAFDSFKGLPPTSATEDWHPRWQAGTMATPLEDFRRKCKQAGIPESDYRVVAGYYSESLPQIAAGDEPRDICLAYIDCDLYSSTKDVLCFLSSRLKHGMIIAFDDWYLWSAKGLSGEKIAFDEFCSALPLWKFHPYLPIGWHGLSFIVEHVGG